MTLPSSEHAGFTSLCDATMLPWCPLGLCHTLSPLAKKEKKGVLHIMYLKLKNIPFDLRIYYTIRYVRLQGNFIIFLLKLFSFRRQLRSACVRGASQHSSGSSGLHRKLLCAQRHCAGKRLSLHKIRCLYRGYS